jgi:hypothetical protein
MPPYVWLQTSMEYRRNHWHEANGLQFHGFDFARHKSAASIPA